MKYDFTIKNTGFSVILASYLCDTIIKYINTFCHISVNLILIFYQFTNTTTPKTISNLSQEVATLAFIVFILPMYNKKFVFSSSNFVK